MSAINELSKRFKFERENDKIKVIPLTKYTFRTYPIDTNYILLTDDEFIGLSSKVYSFNNDLTSVIPFDFKDYLKR